MDSAGAEIVLHPAQRAESLPAEKRGLLTPFKYRPAAQIPRREFLYGTHYAKRFLSLTIAHGGVGKSGLGIVEALAMASGKPLLGVLPPRRLRVAYWNGEDPFDETERRIAAAIMHFGLDGRDLEPWLFTGSGRENNLIIAEQTHGGAAIYAPGVDQVKAAARVCRLDVLIIDPFVSSHRVTENDNGAIDMVAKTWGGIAEDCNLAVDLCHHARKGAGSAHEVTIEDGRGATALMAAARSARVLNTMSESEATSAGVERRRSYFKVENGKANLAPPPDGATWYRFVGIDLGNAPSGERSDNVGVVTSWTMPDAFDGVSDVDALKVQETVQAGNYRESIQAKDWVGHAVAAVLRLNVDDAKHKAKIKALLKTWFKTGVLAVEERHDPQRREPKPFVIVGKWIAP